MLDDHDLNRLIAGVGWSWCVHTTFSSRVNPQGSLEMTGCREGDEASRSTSIRIGAGIDLDNRRVEAIGSKRTSEQAFEMMRPNNTAMVIGVIPVGQLLEIDGESLRYEKTLTGSNMGSIRFRVDMARYVDFYSPASSTSTR